MQEMTVGDLCAAHVGRTFSIAPGHDDGPPEVYTGELVRVTHNAPSFDYWGRPTPARTWVVVASWGGELDPSYPIILTEADDEGGA